jgi:hypothetical protein
MTTTTGRTIKPVGEGSFHVYEDGKPVASFKYEADAKEFAAAPDLYKALHAIIVEAHLQKSSYSGHYDLIADAEAALSRARG